MKLTFFFVLRVNARKLVIFQSFLPWKTYLINHLMKPNFSASLS